MPADHPNSPPQPSEPSSGFETLSLPDQERVDRVCLAFEDAWQRGDSMKEAT
jgi:hypothetical protein